jgi:hypothetical protein
LFRYLAEHALNHPGTPLKEYELATEAVGRPADFDPQTDSSIRVQVARLRQKLAEYYAGEGAEDLILVELPKGSYTLTFHAQENKAAKPHTSEAGVPAAEVTETGTPRRGLRIATAAPTATILIAAAMVIVAVVALLGNLDRHASPAARQPAPTALMVFWKPFLTGAQEPLAVYSNALFVGRPDTGLRYFEAGRDSLTPIFDQYTGVGEVIAVHDLDQMFGALGRQMVVKRGGLFTLDDAQSNNVIFIGAPSENLTLTEIPGTVEFVFERLSSGPRKGDSALVNAQPNPGEQRVFLASPSNEPMREDYATVALMRGLNPAHWVMILAGTTTFGTQGAVEYVCQDQDLKALLLRLAVGPDEVPNPFEAVLQVKVTNGVPIEENLVAVHERP